MESASKQITEMNLLLNRASTENESLTAQNKELNDWKMTDDLTRSNLEKQFQAMKSNWETSKLELAKIHENNINLEKTAASYYNKIESLSAQLTNLESHKNEAEIKCAELQIKLDKTEALYAELQPKLLITHTENRELLAQIADLQTKLDGAPAFYQDLIDKKAKDYYLKGVEQGHKKCLNLYGFVEADSEDEENEPENADLTITANKEGASARNVGTQCIGDGSCTGEFIKNVNIDIEVTADGTSSSEVATQIEPDAITLITGVQLTLVSETLEEKQTSESVQVLTQPLEIPPLAMCSAKEPFPRSQQHSKNT